MCFLVFGCKDSILVRTAQAMSIIHDAFNEFHYEPNYGPGKSEILLAWFGQKAQDMRRGMVAHGRRTSSFVDHVECLLFGAQLGMLSIRYHI